MPEAAVAAVKPVAVRRERSASSSAIASARVGLADLLRLVDIGCQERIVSEVGRGGGASARRSGKRESG